MSRHRSQSFRKPQLPPQEKEKEKDKEREREKEERQGSVGGLAQGVVYEPLIFRSLLSSRWRFSSTSGLKLTSTDDSQGPPSPPKARSPKERHDQVSPQAQGQGHGHELKRRASASACTAPLVRPAIPHRTSSRSHTEHRDDSSATAVLADAKRIATPDPSSPRRRRRRDSATSSRPLSPTTEAKEISNDNASKPAKPSFARRRSSQGQGQVKPELKKTSEEVLNTASNTSEISLRSSLKKDKPTPDPPPSSIPESVIESKPSESTEPPAEAEPSTEPLPPSVPEPLSTPKTPTEVQTLAKPEPSTEPLPHPSPSPPPSEQPPSPSPPPSEPPSPPKPPPKPHHPPTRPPTTTPKPEHLAILGPLANFIPVPKPLPPPRPPSPPTILPLSKSPKNASRVRFGDTTIYSVSPTGRHLHPIGPKQFKTRSGLSYLNPPADPLSVRDKRRTVVEWKGVGGAKMRRHRERQAAMARYWLRTEEEERAGREEKRRRAEGVVRRYAEEPGKGPLGEGDVKKEEQKVQEKEDKGDGNGKDESAKDGLGTKAHRELSTFLIVVVDRAPTLEEIMEDKEVKTKEVEKKDTGKQGPEEQDVGKQDAGKQEAGKQPTEKQAAGKQDAGKLDAGQDIPVMKKEVGSQAETGVFEATTGTGTCSGKQWANVGEQSSKDSPALTGTRARQASDFFISFMTSDKLPE